MGIRFNCPNGHKLNVKDFQAGLRGICPYCGAKFQIPTQSTRPPSKKSLSPSGQQAAKPQPSPPAAAIAGSEARDAAAAASQSQAPAASPSQPRSMAEPQARGASAPAAEQSPASGAPSGRNDPLAGAGDVVWYVRPPAGGQFGPAGSQLMRTWIEEGRVGTDSLVWREGWRDWKKAGEVFPQLDAEHAKSLLREIKTETTSPATTVHTAVIKPRRRSSEHRTTIILLLSLAVVILAAILIWVLALGVGGGGVDASDNARAPADWRCPVQASLLPIVPPPVT